MAKRETGGAGSQKTSVEMQPRRGEDLIVVNVVLLTVWKLARKSFRIGRGRQRAGTKRFDTDEGNVPDLVLAL